MPEKTTQETIAQALGVSRTTVSRALRLAPGPNRKTAAEIIRRANEMGYQLPSTQTAARRKSKNKRGKVAIVLVVGEPKEAFPGSGVLQEEFIEGALSAGRERRVHLEFQIFSQAELLALTSQSRLPAIFGEAGSRTALLFGQIPSAAALWFNERALCLRLGSTRPGMDVIGQNDWAATHLLAKYLSDLGHRRIGFVGNGEPRSYNFYRYGAFMGALAKLGLDSLPGSALNIGPHKARLENELADQIRRIGLDACICAHDGIAYRLAEELAPEECSLVGFDDLPASKGRRKVTSIRWAFNQMAEAAITALLERRRYPNHSLRTILFDGFLVEGETVVNRRTAAGHPKT